MVPLTGGSQNRPLSRAIDSVVCYVLAYHLTLTTASSGVDEASRGDEEVEIGYVLGNEEMQPITNPIRKCNNVRSAHWTTMPSVVYVQRDRLRK